MSLRSLTLGHRGERRAAWFYLLRGYRIVARNLRLAGGEIDLLVRRGRTLVVVEVKTRESLRAGEGHEAVDRAKRQQLIRLGEQLLAREPAGTRLRYDVMSLRWTGRRFIVNHIADAFHPTADPARPWQWRA
jgi:putative endonuclease